MKYPLELNYKNSGRQPLVSLADSSGNLIFVVDHRPSDPETAVIVFSDHQMKQPLYTISPDWILDFSAQYHFTDQNGRLLGSVRRNGERSMWRTRFEIMNGGPPNLRIHEESPWAKMIDALIGEIPLVGAVIPRLAYLVRGEDDTTLVRIEKRPAWLESKFTVEKRSGLKESEETRVLLSLLILVLSEQVAI